MIGKGTSIAHTGTSIAYGWNREKGGEIVFGQHLAGEMPQEVTEEFKLVQEQNTRCQKNTLSFILSPTPEDGKDLTKDRLGELTQKFISEMQLKEHQAIAFVHRDKEHSPKAMGYKKLDEVMELLTDELDGFNKAIERLERLTQNVENIKIKPDTTEIEIMLKENLNTEKNRNKIIHESIWNIGEQISKARLVPKIQSWFQYSIWFISLVLIGYLTFRLSQIVEIKEDAFAKGEKQVISDLRQYFEQNPDNYRSYQKWIREKDSVPNQK
jgi:hypothetical protein